MVRGAFPRLPIRCGRASAQRRPHSRAISEAGGCPSGLHGRLGRSRAACRGDNLPGRGQRRDQGPNPDQPARPRSRSRTPMRRSRRDRSLGPVIRRRCAPRPPRPVARGRVQCGREQCQPSGCGEQAATLDESGPAVQQLADLPGVGAHAAQQLGGRQARVGPRHLVQGCQGDVVGLHSGGQLQQLRRLSVAAIGAPQVRQSVCGLPGGQRPVDCQGGARARDYACSGPASAVFDLVCAASVPCARAARSARPTAQLRLRRL
jgi:hypothetical protein